jgi:hypothetical protein
MKKADVFLNSTNFAQTPFITFVPPSIYTLNIKALTKVSKLAKHLSHIKHWDLHLEENLEKTNFISPNKHLPKAQVY